MPRSRRMMSRLLLALMTVAALGLVSPGTSQASCVGPLIGLGTTVSDQPAATPADTRIKRGDAVVVSGRWFHDGCGDTVATTVGCTGPRVVGPEPETPQRGVALVLSQGDRSWTLDTQDASAGAPFSISWHGTVPADATRGAATLSAAGAELAVTIS